MLNDISDSRNRGTRSLAAKIALRGGRVGASSFVAGWVPHCDTPVEIQRRVTSREAHNELRICMLKIRDQSTAMEVSALVPCRRCAKCLQFRQMKWRERAIWEMDRAYYAGRRTWFVTLTFDPIHLCGILMEARSSSIKDIERAAYKHAQRYFKRLRKLRCQFRYLAVYELGEKSGRPHYHIFLHENGSRPVLKETIESEWRSNVHARLVGSEEADRNASYLTKYTTKSLDIRPRASARYGKPTVPQKTRFLGVLNTRIHGGVKTDDAQIE